MLDDTAVSTGSAPDTTATNADPSQATTQPVNGAQNGQPQQFKGFHEHPDWQRMVAERRQDRQIIAQLKQELQKLDQRTQPQPTQPSPDEQAAGEALKRLIGQHPELKGLLEAPKYGQELASLKQMVQQMLGVQRTGMVHGSRQIITEAATRLGVDAGKLEKVALGFLVDDPGLYQRFQSGDPAVVREVLKDVEDNIFGKLKREAQASLGQSKLATAQLPTRGTSTLPGEAAPKPLEPGKEREYRRDMHTDARRLLRELTQG